MPVYVDADKDDKDAAIWFKDGRWYIGEEGSVGSTDGFYRSRNAMQCPVKDKGTTWQYRDMENQWHGAVTFEFGPLFPP